jgi:PAS domain S-box-containing protein
MALGFAGLAAWGFDIDALKSLWPGRPRMPANSAVLFIVLGTALWLRPGDLGVRRQGIYRGIGQFFAGVCVVFGVVTLIEHLSGWNSGLDEWLFRDSRAARYDAIPGRLSFPSALTAVGLGLGIALLDVRVGRAWVSQVLAVMSSLIPLLAIIGHLCNVEEFYGSAVEHEGTGMAVHEALGFLVLGAGVLCARAERGLTAVLWSHTPGGTLARWLMLAPCIGLFLTGIVYLVLNEGLDVHHSIRTWALGLSNLTLVTLPIWFTAQALHQSGLERDELLHTLEERVQERTAALTTTNAALRESEERLRVVMQNMPVMMAAFDADGNVVIWNRECELVTGYSAEEIIGRPEVMDLLSPDSEARQKGSDLWKPGGGDYRDREWRVTQKNGEVRTISWSNISRTFPIPGWASWGIGVDITERKQAEARLNESLHEKEALLQEIHHRVKNNLQLIASLLRLQAAEIRDPALLTLFEESRSRIHAMALIHERLYRTDRLGSPNYAGYLRDLVVAIGRAYRRRNLEVGFSVEATAQGLGLETAVPIGLIVNELVSNSLKHAFPVASSCRITVRLEGDAEGGYLLRVEDNGVGLPMDFEIERTRSMGLRLVDVLVRQLHGRIEIQRNGGTGFCIQFGGEPREGEAASTTASRDVPVTDSEGDRPQGGEGAEGRQQPEQPSRAQAQSRG